MTVATYKHLALDWQPSAKDSRNFNRMVCAVILLITLLAIAVSIIKVPAEKKHQRIAVPERIADFIARKEKPKVIPPKPAEKPLPPKPKVEEVKPVEKNEVIEEVARQRDKERKPLTDSEIKARKVAEKSGLLALANELNDLIDTKNVNEGLSKNLSAQGAGDGANIIAGHGTDAISGSAAQSGGGVDAKQYGGTVAKTDLDARAIGQDFAEHKTKAEAKAAAIKSSGNNMSVEENVTIVFDKNKGSLYSLYERERRTTQGIQGKIVLQITISPAGDVTDVKIVSSELNSPELETKIVSRVKTFKFNISGDKPVTLNYPIEFLPS